MEHNLTSDVTTDVTMKLNGPTNCHRVPTINHGLDGIHNNDGSNNENIEPKMTMHFADNESHGANTLIGASNDAEPAKSQSANQINVASNGNKLPLPPPPPPPSFQSMKPNYDFADGEIINVTLTKNHAGLGLSLAGNRDRMKTSVFICGINPEGPSARDGRIKIGDEILEVNQVPIYGRCHLNASAIMKSLAGPTYDLVILRRDQAIDDMAVKRVSTFPASARSEVDSDDLRNMSTLNVIDLPRGNRSSFSSINEESLLRSDEDARTRKILTSAITTIELKRDQLGLGISIVGGIDTPLPGVFVHEVLPGGIAFIDSRLAPGDQLLFINGQDLTDCTHEQATALMQETPPVCGLTVYRDQDQPNFEEIDIELSRKPGKPLGLKLSSFSSPDKCGVFIDEIIKYNCGCEQITRGDKLLALDEHNLSQSSPEDVTSMFRLAGSRVKLRLSRLKCKPIQILNS